ncbi:MAG: hypothetical protein CM15mP58_13140 [Burkholderiaceae bacterium]|nr:MAG: hypothetical protein CM15mP58_13140 [Burkholderiaceae bacterium]
MGTFLFGDFFKKKGVIYDETPIFLILKIKGVWGF